MVIAEIGNNHEGSFDLAKEMIWAAASCGVDAVKFQSITPQDLILFSEVDRLEQLRKFAFSYEQFTELSKVAAKAKVAFLSTPFSIKWAKDLANICPAIKISSGDNNFEALLRACAETKLPLLLSTGMTDLGNIQHSLAILEERWGQINADPGVVLMHCVSAYPTPINEANLSAIQQIATLGKPVGYSDHTIGVSAAILSVAYGARVIEKHFTLSKNQSNFRDHKLSADVLEMRELVVRVKEAQSLIGDSRKHVMPSEYSSILSARRSLAFSRDLHAGHALTLEDICWLRPGSGLAIGQEKTVVGKRLLLDVCKGSLIAPSQFIEGI